MSKLLLFSTILVGSVLAHAETYASSPATVTCATCKTDTDFWVYGAGYIESNHGGAFAAFTSNDRVIVQNLDNVRYMIDVDSVISTVCFIYCFSYDQRGKWKITFQNLNGSPAKVVMTFLHVLRENFEKLHKKEAQAQLERSLSAMDDYLLAAEAYFNSDSYLYFLSQRDGWRALDLHLQLQISPSRTGTVTQNEYPPGEPVPIPDIDFGHIGF